MKALTCWKEKTEDRRAGCNYVFVDGLVDGDVMQRVVASLQGLDKKQWIERKLPENLWRITWHSLIVCWLPT